MATVEHTPHLTVDTDYDAWLAEVRSRLASVQMELELWHKNWPYDFHGDYDAGMAAPRAASRALDFWWQHLMAESWT